MKRRLWILVCLAGCASPKPVPPKAEAPASIRRIAVDKFAGPAGAEFAQDMAKALAAQGWVIADRKQGVDAVLIGSVNEYAATVPAMVFLGNTNTLNGGQTLTVSNPVISRNGSQVLPQGPSVSLNNPHMKTEAASVAVSVKLFRIPGGRALWADGFTYESLDLASARQVVVTSLAQSLQRAIPPGGKGAAPKP